MFYKIGEVLGYIFKVLKAKNNNNPLRDPGGRASISRELKLKQQQNFVRFNRFLYLSLVFLLPGSLLATGRQRSAGRCTMECAYDYCLGFR